MPRNSIGQYSTTPGDNTDIGGINIAEGMLPSDVNNAMRELLSQLKEFQTGAGGDTISPPVLIATTATVGTLKATSTATFDSAVILSSDATLRGQSDLRFADSDSSNWVAFQAPATVASNVTWTLPASDGTNGQLLSTNGSGALSWASGGGGGSSISAGDSKVEVTDTGTGKIEFTVDNVEIADFTTGAVVFNETGANQDFRVEGDGNANLIFADASADKVGFGTNTFNTNGGVIQVSNGISFPATQSASTDANTLDDYEEGTFTPELKFGGNAVSLTYSSRAGIYTKIGRCVTVSFVFVLSNKGSSSGFATVSLPFSSDEYGQPNQPGYPGGLAFYGGMTNATKAGFIVGNIGAAGYVTASTTSTDSGNYATEANFNNNTTFGMTVTYNTST